MPAKVVLIKLAAIGDVTLACRAVRDFAARHNAELSLHWIIDENLQSLAQSLTRYPSPISGIKIVWHPISATKLFQGSKIEKAKEALKLFGIVAKVQPQYLLLLHRDWRYKAILRPAFFGRLKGLSRKPIHELDSYLLALKGMAKALKIKPNPSRSDEVQRRSSALSGKIGILVGGAQNQKLLFQEKRWPRLHELVPLLLNRTESKIIFFGGPTDKELAEELLQKVPVSDRIENLVGEVALSKLPELMSELDTFISVDSGLAHIASSVMTAPHQRVITLFGPTNPKVWKPIASGSASAKLLYKAKACSPCYSNDGQFQPCQFEGIYFQHCMTDITPEEIIDSISS